MASKLKPLSRLTNSLRPYIRSTNIQPRSFSACPSYRTDGVYRELTAMRTRVPFIEAFRKQQNEGSQSSPIPTEKVERDLSPKSMSDSHTRIILPLARDPWLLDSYINSSGHIRLGTIFMDLDALAGVIAYKHTGDSVMTVTAAVDRITLKQPLNQICDLELSGRVTFATGRSSMEVSIQVAKAPEEGKEVEGADVLMTCAFTMVSLDPATKKPVNISPLKTNTPEEKAIFDQGEANYNLKKSMQSQALRKQTPNDEESDLIHALWLAQLDYHNPNTPARKPSSALYMKSTQIHSTQIMQPQYRNRHNFMIFGGFLLKSTFELAFTCASSISHTRPTFIALDPSTFLHPVPVGSVLYLTATVAYSDSPLPSLAQFSPNPSISPDPKTSPKGSSRIQIRVDSKVRSIEGGETKPTGTFNYTFQVGRELQVVPETYGEFMMFLDARRRGLVVNRSLGEGEGRKGGVLE
ncbi:Thioesterase/thiol ester dehydrase-isomerase [Mollisia scopiformis]|uniref:Thioesterase/thiol ester dehydrase-isomerase n=1 Tax=Mollisia scopiformis TaxID=149040 RepID=A0A194XEJ5_MOLSC|nr:Thioesterase/thiol ester dehydrase-isomerase [Mollisia scopiformis]KUJ18177.1 Thioesterase/thiol ester dehydrase-isomerase [Mollisia scopiformis]